MALEALIVLLVIGVVGSIVMVIVGAVLGGWPLLRLGVFAGGDSLGQIATATIGAVMLLNPIGVLPRA